MLVTRNNQRLMPLAKSSLHRNIPTNRTLFSLISTLLPGCTVLRTHSPLLDLICTPCNTAGLFHLRSVADTYSILLDLILTPFKCASFAQCLRAVLPANPSELRELVTSLVFAFGVCNLGSVFDAQSSLLGVAAAPLCRAFETSDRLEDEVVTVLYTFGCT